MRKIIHAWRTDGEVTLNGVHYLRYRCTRCPAVALNGEPVRMKDCGEPRAAA